jgi:hypothetical protein
MFDWYLSPADKFQYETDFRKYTDSDTVTLQQLDPLFQQSRISTADFLQIWQLIDIRFQHRIQKLQFVYFMHLLVSKRRGWPVPISLPLHIKEEFLKQAEEEEMRNVYIRPHDNINDVGKSMGKNVKELQEELQLLTDTISATQREQELLDKRFHELEIAKIEVNGMRDYFQRKPLVKYSTKEIEEIMIILEKDYHRLVELSK